MAKKKKKARRKAKRKNPTRHCGICRSAKHDRRTCKSKSKRKSRKSRKARRRNPGTGLSYKSNPCETCGCDCKDVAAGASRFLRSRLRRRNPGFSWKKGKVVPHEQQFDELYQKPVSSRLRYNPCGSRRHRTTRNPWGNYSFHEPLSKRLRRLCRSDFSNREISDILDIPVNWVDETCRTERRRF